MKTTYREFQINITQTNDGFKYTITGLHGSVIYPQKDTFDSLDEAIEDARLEVNKFYMVNE